MKLSILERIVLGHILPQKGSFITLKLARKAAEELSFSEKEIKQFNIHEEGGVFKWEPDTGKEKNFMFSESIYNLIVKALKELDQKEALDKQHVSLYQKFVLGE